MRKTKKQETGLTRSIMTADMLVNVIYDSCARLFACLLKIALLNTLHCCYGLCLVHAAMRRASALSEIDVSKVVCCRYTSRQNTSHQGGKECLEKFGKREAIAPLALTRGSMTFQRERLGTLMDVKQERIKP